MEDRPYTLSMQKEIDQGEYSFVIHTKETPFDDWSILIGEIVCQLRSALDHIIYDLSAVDANGRKPDFTEFPIFLNQERYLDTNKGGGLYKIRGLPIQARASIERYQPFLDWQHPTEHVLWILHELSNIDKHRFLHPSGVVTGCRDLTLEVEGDLPVETLFIREDGKAENGAKLAQYRVGPIPPGVKGKVRMKGDIGYHIAFDDASPAVGRPLKNSLDLIGQTVAAIYGDLVAFA